jgi:hypothetical protein
MWHPRERGEVTSPPYFGQREYGGGGAEIHGGEVTAR